MSYVAIYFLKETPNPESPGLHLSSANVKTRHTITRDGDIYTITHPDWAHDLEVPAAAVKAAFRAKAQPAKK